MDKQLFNDMVESLENQNSKLLLMSYDKNVSYENIMNKILHNLETIQLIKNNEVEGIVCNGETI